MQPPTDAATFDPNNPAASGMIASFDDEFNSLAAAPSASAGDNGVVWETNFQNTDLLGGNNLTAWHPLDPAIGGLGQTPFNVNNGITSKSTTPELAAAGVKSSYTGGHLDTYKSIGSMPGPFPVPVPTP